MLAGAAAITTVGYLGLDGFDHASFVATNMTTLFTGLYLSLFCTVIYGLITAVDSMRNKLRQKKDTH